MNVMRRRSGRISVPPGPSKRSRCEMSLGACQRTGVPVGCFFFFFCAKPVSIEVMLSSSAKRTSAHTLRVRFITPPVVKGGSVKGNAVTSIDTGATDEICLRVEGFRALIDRQIPAVGFQLARFRVVTQICFEQHVSQVTFRLWISYRRYYFDSMFQISRHPVGAADVDLIVAAV